MSDGLPPESWARDAGVRRGMLANTSTGTSPELRLRWALEAGADWYEPDAPLPIAARRRCDMLYHRERVAVFVDGCFWHGCPLHYKAPRGENGEWYWAPKILRNMRRDDNTDHLLILAGLAVMRFWEHDMRTEGDALRAAMLVARVVGWRA